jgi:cobalt-zinc-cadmium efflux system outer membrane protein
MQERPFDAGAKRTDDEAAAVQITALFEFRADGICAAVCAPVKFVRLTVVLGFSFVMSVTAPAQTLRTASTQARLTLDTAVTEALEKNLELMATRAGITIAQANAITARLRPNPVLSLGGDHLDWLGTGFDDVNGAGPPEYSVRLDLLLERGGKRAGRIAIAEEERTIAEAEVLDAVRRLKLDVQHAFVDLQLAQENLVLARENAAGLDEVVTLNQARVRGGEIAEVELLRSRVAALQSQQAVRAAELKVRSERRRLERVIGRTPDAQPLEIQALEQPASIAASAAHLQARAVVDRPDLISFVGI